jgi:hypothetical protein
MVFGSFCPQKEQSFPWNLGKVNFKIKYVIILNLSPHPSFLQAKMPPSP